MKLPLQPELVPAHIDGFVVSSSQYASRRLHDKRSTLASGSSTHRDELELNLVLRGRAEYLIGQMRVTLSAHSMLWLLPRQKSLLFEVSSDFESLVLVCRRRVVKRAFTTDDSAPLRRSGGTEVLLKQLTSARVKDLALLYQSIPIGRGRDVFNTGLAYALTRSWLSYREAESMQAPPEVSPAVRRAAWLLRDHSDPLDNASLARACGLSANRLSRLFKRQMGVSISEFRNRQRIDRLLSELARDEPRSLMQLAFDVGFGSYAQFHRVFRRYVGMSPASYTRQRST